MRRILTTFGLAVGLTSLLVYYWLSKRDGAETLRIQVDEQVNTTAPPAGKTGQWGRHVVTLVNTSFADNPFELEVDGLFTHVASGTTLRLPGYYAGDGLWRLGFMPTLTGEWTYITSSTDPELNGVTGAFTCAPSDNRGLLSADHSMDSRKWRFADGTYVIPVALRMEFAFELASTTQFNAAADFLQTNNIQMMDTRLQDEGTSRMLAFEGDYSDHRFDLTYWDRLQERMDALTARGLGAYIMFYADDAGTPRWSGKSATEAQLIRYAVARLAGYPLVIFDTGIDIWEYRNASDVAWFGNQLAALDPYDHPRSSRGGVTPNWMPARNYESKGDWQPVVTDMIDHFEAHDVPVGMFDAWGENMASRGNFSPTDIRRSIWKAVAAGGLAVTYRGNDGYFHINSVESDLESEQWLRLVNPFIQQRLGTDFGKMVPAPDLVSNGYSLADPGHAKILYFLMGVNDSVDSGDGRAMTVKLAGILGSYRATWFDPRTGTETSAGMLNGGTDHTLAPPTTDDWILLLVRH